jgi:hypothetical protein
VTNSERNTLLFSVHRSVICWISVSLSRSLWRSFWLRRATICGTCAKFTDSDQMLSNFKGIVTTRSCRCLLVYLTLTRKEKYRSKLVARYCLLEVRETHYWRLERDWEREQAWPCQEYKMVRCISHTRRKQKWMYTTYQYNCISKQDDKHGLNGIKLHSNHHFEIYVVDKLASGNSGVTSSQCRSDSG